MLAFFMSIRRRVVITNKINLFSSGDLYMLTSFMKKTEIRRMHEEEITIILRFLLKYLSEFTIIPKHAINRPSVVRMHWISTGTEIFF